MIYKVVILLLTTVVGIGLTWKYTMNHTHPYAPVFHVKQCFLFDLEQNKYPSGIIAMVGDYDYHVLWYKEADRRYGGPKLGAKVPMKWLDQYAHQVPCPGSWRSH